MEEKYIYYVIGVIAFGFMWRWIDRVDKKIDKIVDFMKDMASKAELKEMRTELKMELEEVWKRIVKLEDKYNGCVNCKSK